MFTTLNDELIFNCRKPVAILNVEAISPIHYKDQFIRVGEVMTVSIFANGSNGFVLREFAKGGGYVIVSDYLENHIQNLRLIGVERINFGRVASPEHENVLRNISNKYNVDFFEVMKE